MLDACWLNDSLALATENIFQDHTGVVNYDPTYANSKAALEMARDGAKYELEMPVDFRIRTA